jgi:isopenicillin N synthase-like dioxygenase
MSIPTISLSQPREALISAIRTACLTHGFFQLTSHAIPASLQSSLFAQMAVFFSQSTSTKRCFLKQDHIEGGYEQFQKYSLQAGRGEADLNEGFAIGPAYVKNRWPDETAYLQLGGFRETCEHYYAAMHTMAREVGGLIAEGLGLEKGYFEGYFKDELAHARLIHYFRPDAAGDGTEELGAGAHTDWGLITLLLQDEVGGLKVQDKDTGEWLDVPPTPGAYVVNCGDLLARFTNGVYVSARHKVLAPPKGVHRYSVPYFSDGNPEHVVDVLPMGSEWKEWVSECKGEAPKAERLWEPAKAGVYFEGKWLESVGGGKVEDVAVI